MFCQCPRNLKYLTQVIAIVDAVDKYFIPNKQHQKAVEILQAVTKVQRCVHPLSNAIIATVNVDMALPVVKADSNF
jgi:hypothetical protein